MFRFYIAFLYILDVEWISRKTSIKVLIGKELLRLKDVLFQYKYITYERNMKPIFVLTILFMICFSRTSYPNSSITESIPDSLESKIDTMITRMGFSSETPGGTIGIIKDGKLIFKKAYGLSNFERKEANKTNTLFNLGSVSKQFTAAAILLLSRENKLSLKDDIRKYLPDFPDYGYTITIENLIHHTSGIKSYDVLKLMAGTLFSKESLVENYKLIAKQKSLNFKPGDEYMYSNSGYTLLAMIVQKVSGMEFSKFIEDKVFRPIGMNQSFIYDNPKKITGTSASGHTWGGDRKFKTSGVSDNTGVGSSNVYTCIDDFLNWDNNFYNNKLGNWNFFKEMTSQVTLTKGDTCNYAFGIEISKYNGLKIISHQGGTSDFTAQYIQIPSENFSVVCLFNIPTNVTGLAYQIMDLFIKKGTATTTSIAKPEKVNIDSSILKTYAGKYFDDNYWLESSITQDGDHLLFDTPYQGKFEIYPLSDSLFFVTFADLKLAFSKDHEGKVKKATIIQGNQQFSLNYLGTKTLPVFGKQLCQYSGDYLCEEIDATYSILFNDDKLFIKLPESTAQFCHINAQSELISEHDDYFASPVGCGIKFLRNNQNEVSGFIIKDVGRVRNLVFNKVN